MLTLFVQGMTDDQEIKFHGEGDQEPGVEAGDIIIVLDEKEHQRFKRRGADLFVKLELELADALCGFTKTIKTLDNRQLVINTLPGAYFILCTQIKQIFRMTLYTNKTYVS